MTITRQSQDAIGVPFEQDADEFFIDMARPATVLCPFRIETFEMAYTVFSSWRKNGWLTEDAFSRLIKRPVPIEAMDPLPSGHTRGYMLMKSGRIGVKDLDVQGMKQAAEEHEEAAK